MLGCKQSDVKNGIESEHHHINQWESFLWTTVLCWPLHQKGMLQIVYKQTTKMKRCLGKHRLCGELNDWDSSALRGTISGAMNNTFTKLNLGRAGNFLTAWFQQNIWICQNRSILSECTISKKYFKGRTTKVTPWTFLPLENWFVSSKWATWDPNFLWQMYITDLLRHRASDNLASKVQGKATVGATKNLKPNISSDLGALDPVTLACRKAENSKSPQV